MSSIRHDWATPQKLFRMLDGEFHFTLDVCASWKTATVKNWFGYEQDALSRDWSQDGPQVCWMNPPYGRAIGKWIEKAHRESQRGCTVVCLVAARTDTSWWHDYCMKAEIRFLRGRLSFDDDKRGRCPFPSAIVVFRCAVGSGA